MFLYGYGYFANYVIEFVGTICQVDYSETTYIQCFYYGICRIAGMKCIPWF